MSTKYSVYCFDCDSVLTPLERSPLWWIAKKQAESGRLDAVQISGERCGCKKEKPTTDKHFSIFGYTPDCQDFCYGYDTFVDVVQAYREIYNSGSVVFIKGISMKTERHLEFL